MTTLNLPRLYAIVDVNVARQAGYTVPALAAAYLDGGAKLLQLRCANVTTGQYVGWARDIVLRAERYEANVIINDRVDVARLSGATGVHVGQDDLSVKQIQCVVGEAVAVGVSTHNLLQLDAAVRAGVSYVAVGPVYETKTKANGYLPLGLEYVRAAAKRCSGVPIVGIGGITLERAADVIAAGAQSVAVISDLFVGRCPTARVGAYVERLVK